MIYKLIPLLFLLAPLIALAFWFASPQRRRAARLAAAMFFTGMAMNPPKIRAYNGGTEFLGPTVTLQSTSAHTLDYILVKPGAAGFYDVCGANDQPLGICPDTVSSTQTGESRAVHVLGLIKEIIPIRVSEAATAGHLAYTDANGKVQDGTPGASGTYYMVGIFYEGQTVVGGLAKLIPCLPVKLVVP